MSSPIHIPILAAPIVRAMKDAFETWSEPNVMIDCTFGGGGHTRLLLEALPAHHVVLGVDQDAVALENGRGNFATEIASGRLILLHSNFAHLSADQLQPVIGDRPVGGILADLGFSSDQLEDAERGLSFLREGPLDMRLDRSSGSTALELLKTLQEKELADLIYEYGEERFSRKIASAIVRARQSKTLPETTTAFADFIVKALPPPARKGRIHAATRTFQALRIAVNDELGALDLFLTDVMLNLRVGGRAAVISFHSLEDRRVKNFFRERDEWEPLTKKPLEADEEELNRNPRARSAKLRIAERVVPAPSKKKY